MDRFVSGLLQCERITDGDICISNYRPNNAHPMGINQNSLTAFFKIPAVAMLSTFVFFKSFFLNTTCNKFLSVLFTQKLVPSNLFEYLHSLIPLFFIYLKRNVSFQLGDSHSNGWLICLHRSSKYKSIQHDSFIGCTRGIPCDK